MVLIAGTPQQVAQSLASAEPFKQQLEAAGVLVVPLPFVSSSDGGDSSISIGETPAGGLNGLDPPGPEDLRWRATAIRLDDWRRWFEQQADLAGKSLSDGLYISLRLDGRVRGSGKGSPPWAVMAAQLPPTEGKQAALGTTVLSMLPTVLRAAREGDPLRCAVLPAPKPGCM